MKKFIAACAALLVFCASAPLAQAATPYAGLSAGVSILTNSDVDKPGGTVEDGIEYDTGYGLNGAVGLDGGMYRVEGAIGYQVNGVKTFDGDPETDVDVSALTFMANGYVDIPMNGAGVEPYLMAGIGVASVSFNDDSEGIDDSDTVLAYQFGGGLAFDATPNVTVDIGYRYFLTGDVTFDDVDYDGVDGSDVDISVSGHNIMAGVRVGL